MKLPNLFLSLIISLSSITAIAQSDVVDVTVMSEDHTTLVATIKAANLVTTLKGEGPFTIFAPTNESFDKLPAGTVETLLKPASKGKLSSILTYHVISGNFTASAIVKAIKDGNGSSTFKALNGDTLTASIKEGAVILSDQSGNSAKITGTDLKGSNGIVHVIDGVLMPSN